MHSGGKHVIVQGITGTHGAFHTRNMVKYGTKIVAGTSPTKAGTTVDGIPVYARIADIQADMPVDASVIFVPAAFAKAAILEAIAAKVPLIVCITENIPVHDMLTIRQQLQGSASVLIGPNCPGVLIPGGNLLGIIPAHLATLGDTAVVSRSGTLTYEAMDLLTRHGYGQKYVIGIGGDMVRGTGFTECLALFESDPDITRIVMIGEIGGTDEAEAADYIQQNITKPVYAYIAGHSAPVGVQMGHAGAILGTNSMESAQAKTDYLRQSGVTVADSIGELISAIK
ncbi:succinate--CoA ligase subunit alpha [Candidatus Saccharibacteria bacterium 32-49-10]|nr:MAG: succinate--CoA ligase subunit alpha [Candidatus Saccharibacteria bacterium 32-49-10]